MSSVKALLSTVRHRTLTKKGVNIMFINFNDLPKGALKLTLQGYKPVICRPAKQERGWFVRKGDGGKSGEPLVRFNFGTWYSSFQAYDRNGESRHTQTKYVPIKANLIQKKVA